PDNANSVGSVLADQDSKRRPISWSVVVRPDGPCSQTQPIAHVPEILMNLTRLLVVGCVAVFAVSCARPLAAQEANPPATQPAATQPGQTRKLPFLTVDVNKRQ